MHTKHKVACCAIAARVTPPAFAEDGMPRGYEPQQVHATRSTQTPSKLPPKPPADRIVVSVHEFRSNETEIATRATTDVFMTALAKSGQCRVVERARAANRAMLEKQLNVTGLSEGKSAQPRLRASKYLFESTISEATQSQTQRSGGAAIAGLATGGGSNRDVVAIHVPVVEAATGDIVDSVTIRSSIASESSSVSGIGDLSGNALAQRRRSSTYVPEVQVQQKRRERFDQPVATLAERSPR